MGLGSARSRGAALPTPASPAPSHGARSRRAATTTKPSQGEPNGPACSSRLAPSLPSASHGTLSAAGTAAVRKIRDRLRKTNSELKKKKKTRSCSWQSPDSQSCISPRRGSANPGVSYVPKSKAGAIRAIQITHANGLFANKQREPARASGNGGGRNALRFRKVGICWWAVRGRNAVTSIQLIN